MYDSYLDINKRFKSSVNLQYDLNDEDKILQYIPTTDLCDIIKNYIKNILFNTDKATILAGPYGKGKSYLMLMITYIFSSSKNIDSKPYDSLMYKINKIDSELADLMKVVKEKKICLLPVIINGSNSEDLNQNFMLSMSNALIENHMNDIVPKTAFTECLTLLNKWEKESDSEFDIFNKCLMLLKPTTLEKLRLGLQNYDMSSFRQFEKLFSCISHGYPYNPLIGNDIGEIYNDISREIRKFGYTGIFTIFDEFGVFLGNQTNDFISRLNKIQSFAEKCNASDNDSQMHLCCITHKELKLYNNSENSYADQFETISGRFKQYRFDRSLEENYQIICSAIEKKSTYISLIANAKSVYKDFIDKMYMSDIFNSKSEIDYVFENGFPFNPISLFALIQVSEKIAQNERTLFTFVSDTYSSGFNYFISNCSEGMLNLPSIYNYFERVIHNNNDYKSLYYKVEVLKRLTIKEEERNIFKVIALIKIIDDDVKFNCTIDNIALSLGKKIEDINEIITKLIDKNYLKQNMNDHSIDFAVIADSEVNNLIDSIILTKFNDMKISELLNSFDENKYFVSHQYNFEKKITRFFRTIYLESSTLFGLSDLKALFTGEDCDGIIVNLINDSNKTQSEVKTLLNESQIKNIIVRFLDINISKHAWDKLKRYHAAKQLINASKISDTVKNALPILLDDLAEEIQNYLKNFYYNSRAIIAYDNSEKNLIKCINITLSNYYSGTVVINNEQVNKNTISSASAKARNNVVDDMLKNTKIDFGRTSAEATIQASFEEALNNTNNPNIINVVRNWIIYTNGIKQPVSTLINTLFNAPYGMRKGVMPLFISKAISTLSVESTNSIDTVILYNGNSEIELNATNISKLLADPSKYYLCYTQINSNKLKMTKSLLTLFGCKDDISFSENILCLTQKIKSTISNYAPIIIRTTVTDNLLNLSKKSIAFKNLFMEHDLNNYDVLFNRLPSVLNTDFIQTSNEVDAILKEYDTKMSYYYNEIVNSVITKFEVETTTLKTAFDLWKSKYHYIDKVILGLQEKNLYNAFMKIQHNNTEAINSLAYHSIKSPVDDWNEKKEREFNRILDNMINKVKHFKEEESISKDEFVEAQDVKLSSLGKTLYSNIVESMSEYGESISAEEKASVLKKLLNDLLN